MNLKQHIVGVAGFLLVMTLVGVVSVFGIVGYLLWRLFS